MIVDGLLHIIVDGPFFSCNLRIVRNRGFLISFFAACWVFSTACGGADIETVETRNFTPFMVVVDSGNQEIAIPPPTTRSEHSNDTLSGPQRDQIIGTVPSGASSGLIPTNNP